MSPSVHQRSSGSTFAAVAVRLPLVLLLSLPGCAFQRPVIPGSPDHFAEECTPPPAQPALAAPAPSPQIPGSTHLETFSPRFHRIAAALGLIPLLERAAILEQERAAKKEGAEVALIRVRQQILSRTVLAMLEATSLVAVVRCNQVRAEHLANSLAEMHATRTQVATVVSVLIETATMIATGGLIIAGHEVAEGIAALAGGTVAAGLAGLSLYPSGPQHEFLHPSNLLKEVWENPEQPRYFPGPVWRFLREPIDGAQSLREQLVASWRDMSRIKGEDEEQRQRRFTLLFGTGGVYTIEDLRAREAMLEMLAAAIDLMDEELELLVREMLVREDLSQ